MGKVQQYMSHCDRLAGGVWYLAGIVLNSGDT
jgi:hypothetical protein